MNLEDLYKEAKAHKDSHPSCGGEPYKSYEKLDEIIKNEGGPLRILEIGTAVGFTTFILQNNDNHVDTIEFHKEHIDLAKENIKKWGGDVSKIDFMEGDAKDILPTLSDNTYDIIFFDGYGVKEAFYNEFVRILKVNGILITANKHLKSTEQAFFEPFEHEGEWKLEEEFADTVVYRKLI